MASPLTNSLLSQVHVDWIFLKPDPNVNFLTPYFCNELKNSLFGKEITTVSAVYTWWKIMFIYINFSFDFLKILLRAVWNESVDETKFFSHFLIVLLKVIAQMMKNDVYSLFVSRFILKLSHFLYFELWRLTDVTSLTRNRGRRNWGGGRRGSCPRCSSPGGARGAKVPFQLKGLP
jgi:hypothetical protein